MDGFFDYLCLFGGDINAKAPTVEIWAGEDEHTIGGGTPIMWSGGGSDGWNFGDIGPPQQRIISGPGLADKCDKSKYPSNTNDPPVCPTDGADPANGAMHPGTNAPIGFPGGANYAPMFSSRPGLDGGSWAPPAPFITANDDGTYTRDNPDGSEQVLVPLGDLNQTVNGGGDKLFAMPVGAYDRLFPVLPDPRLMKGFQQQAPDGTVTVYRTPDLKTYWPVGQLRPDVDFCV